MALIPALLKTAFAYKAERERLLEKAAAEQKAAAKKAEASGFDYEPMNIDPLIHAYKQRLAKTQKTTGAYQPKMPSPEKK